MTHSSDAEQDGQDQAGLRRLDSQVVIGLHRVVRDLDRRTAEVAREYGLSLPQFAVLEALLTKGPLSVGTLRDAVLSSEGTIPVVVRNLEGRGLVQRHRDERDARRYIVSLTAEGERLARKVVPQNAQALREALLPWSDEDRRRLAELVRTYRSGGR